MPRLRTQESEERYKKLIAAGYLTGGCKLCEAPSVKDFTHWRIIRNDFPYDLIAKAHDMIVPRRHVMEHDLSSQEKKEYDEIKTDHINATYTHIIEPTLGLKSIPGHFHLHLIVAKD
ncbi:MAG: hypothetical protein HYU04_01445 [Candidatus Wildermuthbacteria bacterium]|nr:hypothetical protein [Candidatus Wildermuthbacteria bacterium]